ncbi:molybdopterin-synthase adenylyltransferase MoeB [Dasania sp. GY-MA-18]|uniref:Molybdopterin-synthase adenylyltransferase n=1 Tax=Dasania phycosphaerae TaxID=2950436 RepID=A0A9J6RHI8_9GAMM|nr:MULTISPECIES: molybdopterin-synthase adenylyltransferase MoeB [Dasania]MCR8921488.1 molybdopterin-synthase adenylyltransferase MoeB [Dasania sp. GY-MA-18]MCZ0863916.1 molybdopterin-synthase adenylyltransferase MoeB [Dasania phycosphaerae]MCZ0867644.1 molybdopterin-synthase adenylyltransferase MoeB [Dasania phycosphaerae]
MNDQQLLRYSRHIMMPDFDVAGQQALLSAKVLIVGMGGLGCPVALYLAAAGVGELWLADFDEVELSNLQRQIGHEQADVGRPKVISVAERIAAMNSDVRVETINEHLDGQLLDDALKHVDVVVDASDNFATRFEINRACVAAKKPLVSGAAIRSEGQVAVFDNRAKTSPCYRCLYDDNAQDSQLSCSESGVLAPLVGVIGAMQAMEAIKVISGFGQTLSGQLMIFDAKVMEWRKLSLPKNKHCPVCTS